MTTGLTDKETQALEVLQAIDLLGRANSLAGNSPTWFAGIFAMRENPEWTERFLDFLSSNSAYEPMRESAVRAIGRMIDLYPLTEPD